jgi:hypothetical protein
MNACLTPLSRLSAIRSAALAHLPRSLVILLENVLAHEAEPAPLVARFEEWLQRGEAMAELPFRPARILMQDTAGVAAMADLAALRDHAVAHGHAPGEVDAAIPIDLVIDHSVRVDYSGTPEAATRNLALEYARNRERYRFFKWAEHAFPKFRVVPPGQGICHQINLEMLTNGAVPRRKCPAAGWRRRSLVRTATPLWSTHWACLAGAWADRGGAGRARRAGADPAAARVRSGADRRPAHWRDGDRYRPARGRAVARSGCGRPDRGIRWRRTFRAFAARSSGHRQYVP